MADLTFTTTARSIADVDWYPMDAGDPEPWLRIGRHGGGYVLQFGETACFSILRDASTIISHGGFTKSTLRLLLDQVVPLVLSHRLAARSSVVLHGSGLVVDDCPIGLVGPSGVGKSTLTCALARRGARVLADDALVVSRRSGRMTATPAYPALRVWPDVLTALGRDDRAPLVTADRQKRRLDPTDDLQFSDQPCALTHVYILAVGESVDSGCSADPNAGVRIERLAKRAGVMSLLSNLYVLDPIDAGRLGEQLDAVCTLANCVETRILRFPRDLSRLPEVCDAIQRDLRS